MRKGWRGEQPHHSGERVSRRASKLGKRRSKSETTAKIDPPVSLSFFRRLSPQPRNNIDIAHVAYRTDQQFSRLLRPFSNPHGRNRKTENKRKTSRDLDPSTRRSRRRRSLGRGGGGGGGVGRGGIGSAGGRSGGSHGACGRKQSEDAVGREVSDQRGKEGEKRTYVALNAA